MRRPDANTRPSARRPRCSPTWLLQCSRFLMKGSRYTAETVTGLSCVHQEVLDRLPELLGSAPGSARPQFSPSARPTTDSVGDGATPTAGVAGLGIDDTPQQPLPDSTPAVSSSTPAQHQDAFSARTTADTDGDDTAARRVTEPYNAASALEPRALSDEAANGAAVRPCL